MSLKITGYSNGPFVVIITFSQPEMEDETQVISPPGGFETKEAAMEFIEEYDIKKRPEAGKGLMFEVAPLRSPRSFMVFCSWVD